MCKVVKTKAKQKPEKENNSENFRAKTLDTTEKAEQRTENKMGKRGKREEKTTIRCASVDVSDTIRSDRLVIA